MCNKENNLKMELFKLMQNNNAFIHYNTCIKKLLRKF